MINDQCICHLSADVSVWTVLIKLQGSGSIGSKVDAIVNRRQAIKESEVKIRALIGKAHISFHELEGLSAGDVIIIDSYRDGFADVVLEYSESRIGSGEIKHDDGVVKILLN
jgi:flagellar motor switch/type III secretory pathway protein FliN